MGEFTLRVDDTLLEKFDETCGQRTRTSMIIKLMKRHVEQKTYASYMIKGYSPDHTKMADIIHYSSIDEIFASIRGFDAKEDKAFLTMFEHAKDLMRRNGDGDKEEAEILFRTIFGEKNVFITVKK